MELAGILKFGMLLICYETNMCKMSKFSEIENILR